MIVYEGGIDIDYVESRSYLLVATLIGGQADHFKVNEDAHIHRMMVSAKRQISNKKAFHG